MIVKTDCETDGSFYSSNLQQFFNYDSQFCSYQHATFDLVVPPQGGHCQGESWDACRPGEPEEGHADPPALILPGWHSQGQTDAQ